MDRNNPVFSFPKSYFFTFVNILFSMYLPLIKGNAVLLRLPRLQVCLTSGYQFLVHHSFRAMCHLLLASSEITNSKKTTWRRPCGQRGVQRMTSTATISVRTDIISKFLSHTNTVGLMQRKVTNLCSAGFQAHYLDKENIKVQVTP